MMRMIKYCLLVMCCLWSPFSAVSCSGGQRKMGQESSASIDTSIVKGRFVLPVVPSGLTSPDERAVFVVRNYWSRFDFSDTAMIDNGQVTEQAFADYAFLLSKVDDKTRYAGSKMLFERAFAKGGEKMLDYVENLAEKYLYEVGSPMRNDTCFASVLKAKIDMKQLDVGKKVRAEYLYKMVSKNNVGTLSSDFQMITRTGKKLNLHSVDAELLLLFFNDPDCEKCAAVKAQLMASQAVENAIESGVLKVLAVYTEEDGKRWKKAVYPDEWMDAWDEESKVRDDGIYDLRAMPSLYLLDRDKQVLLKDATINNVIEYLGK